MPNWTSDFRSGHAEIGSGNDVVAGITDIRIAAQSQIAKDITSGNITPSGAHLAGVSPMISLTTLELTEAITHFGLTGKCITAADPLDIYAQDQDCAGIAAGATHRKYTITKGAIVPSSLTIPHRGNASLSFDVYAASEDGSTAPLVVATASLPAAPTPNKRYEMNNVTVAALTVEGKRSITINFNPVVAQEGADSNPYDTSVTVTSISPVITVRGVDPGYFDSIVPLLGLQGSRTNTLFFLKDRDQLNATLAHISLACDAVVSLNDVLTGGPNSPNEAEMQLDVYVDDSANDAFAVNTGIAIP